MSHLQNMLMSSPSSSYLESGLGSLNDIRSGVSLNSSLLSSLLPKTDPYAIEKAAKQHRNAAGKQINLYCLKFLLMDVQCLKLYFMLGRQFLFINLHISFFYFNLFSTV